MTKTCKCPDTSSFALSRRKPLQFCPLRIWRSANKSWEQVGISNKPSETKVQETEPPGKIAQHRISSRKKPISLTLRRMLSKIFQREMNVRGFGTRRP